MRRFRVTVSQGSWLLSTVLVLLAVVGVASAFAEGEEPPASPHPDYSTLGESDNGHSLGPKPDSEAAKELPHEDLGREEALELMRSVFGYTLTAAPEMPAGLEVDRYYSNHVALLAESGPEAEGREGTTLLESALPLRTENEAGEQVPVDLQLEHSEGEIQPANPLVEVGIPDHLREGISLPESGVEIKVGDAPSEVSPTTVEDSTAFFPNVATDSDLAVTPVPTGVETLTQLRSPDAPTSERLHLTMPGGAALRESSAGGIDVVESEETLASVLSPTAFDAQGEPVPVSLKASGASIVIEVDPPKDALYPILVDPVIQSYNWVSPPTTSGLGDWITATNSSVFETRFMGAWGQFGINIYSHSATTSGSKYGSYTYYVPRFFSDFENPNVKERPTTFIKGLSFSNLYWWIEESSRPYLSQPYVGLGLWNESLGKWYEVGWRYGNEGQLTDPTWVYSFTNKNEVTAIKQGVAQMATDSYSGLRHLWIGQATVELSDKDSPGFGILAGPGEWVTGQATVPIQYTVTDTGLGIRELRIVTPSGGGETHQTNVPINCTGGVSSPCPRTVSSFTTTLPYDPSTMPDGEDWAKVYAVDPLGHEALVGGKPREVKIKVDHTAPTLALSGTLTEENRIGPKLGSYSLSVSATDGTEAAPQSGVAKTVIELDGKVVDETSPGCATKNCLISRSWTLDSSQYAAGPHLVKVTATDGVGLSTTEELHVSLQPAPAPTVSLSGTMTEQGSIGTTRPRYKLHASAAAEVGQTGPSTYSTAFGSYGTTSGNFLHPEGMAVDSKGFLWVVDRENPRVQKLKENGEYVTRFGAFGTEPGKLGSPSDIAIDAKGNFWISDAGDNRVDEFNEKREFVAYTDGSAGTGTPFFMPEAIAIDAKGNVWVADTRNARLVELNPSTLAVIRVVGNKGELSEPAGIDVGLSGELWVADRAKDKVLEFSETGQLLHSFGSQGSAPAEFERPGAINVDIHGNVWVGDEGNDRVQELGENGEYIGQLGSEGSGNGQFAFSAQMGLASDSKGNIFVSDPGNSRIQRWTMPAYVITGLGSLGSAGSGPGQLSHPAGVTVDVKGNLWVADAQNYRVDEFDPEGKYLRSIGSTSKAGGELSYPSDVAVDGKGHVWVADDATSLIKEYSESGEYLGSFHPNCTAALGESGQGCSSAEALAVDKEGHLWVADTHRARIEEFNEAGERLKVFDAKGPSQALIYEPTGIAIGPGGNIWIVDWYNDRVLEFTPQGEFVMQFGSEGAGAGKFRNPDVIDLDERGNVWVADEKDNRVEEFNHRGEYVAQFGSVGSEPGQFKFAWPMGIAVDSKGNLWVADQKNNRVQKWNYASTTSEVKTEVTVDGKAVESGQASCLGETCPLATNWTLESPSYPVGEHVVKVKATDGLGRSTTKTLNIGVQRDTIKPTVELSGQLATAPEGWVEQKSYGLTATASDQGGGVTSLAFKIDEKTITSQSQECLEGGCGESISKSPNMANYAGGAHSAEVIATDGAGNTMKRTWTINVDPEGHISTSEAIDTLDAADTTTESTVVASTEEAISLEEREEGNNPRLSLGENGIESGGVPDLSIIDTNPENGFTVDTPEANVHVEPASIGPAVTPMTVSEEAAAISGNTETNVDSVVRPIFDGAMTFQSIRDVTASETYSWKVFLSEGETLKSIDSLDAEIDFEDGKEAMLIAAERAHDAIGSNVPTSLSVSEGDIITLTVSHREGSYVYPVVAGAGWEGGFSTTIIEMPPTEQELQEERERIEQEERELAEEEVEGGGDEPPGENAEVWDTSNYRPKWARVSTSAPEMMDSANRTRRSKAQASYCAILSCSYWHTWEVGTWFWNGKRHQVGGFAWRGDTTPKCYSTDDHPLFDNALIKMGWSGPNPAPYGYGAHLNLWCNFHVRWFNINDLENNYYTLQDHLYGDGYQGQHIRQYYPGPEE